jgi:hypothetical protein
MSVGKKVKGEEEIHRQIAGQVSPKHRLLLQKEAGVVRVKYSDWVNPEPEVSSRDWIRKDPYVRFTSIDPSGLRSLALGTHPYLSLGQFTSSIPASWADIWNFWAMQPPALGPFSALDRLAPMLQAIQDASSITELPASWDENGAVPIDKETWVKATTMLMAYASYVAEHYDQSLPVPQIDPVPDGSIDLFWKESKAQLLINVPPGVAAAGYYGDIYSEDDKIKGKLPVEGVKEYLAVWMKNLIS